MTPIWLPAVFPEEMVNDTQVRTLIFFKTNVFGASDIWSIWFPNGNLI